MSTPLRVLILEDQPADAELMVYHLCRAGFDVKWERVETEEDYLSHLSPELDVILADYNLPQFDGVRALRALQESGLDVPFIIVSGTVGEDVAVSIMRQGATDYLLKDRLTRLGPAVLQVLEQKRLRDEKQTAERLLRRQRDELAARTRIIGAILQTRDLEERLDTILSEAISFLRVETGCVYILRGNRVVLHCQGDVSNKVRAHLLHLSANPATPWMCHLYIVHEALNEQGSLPEFFKQAGIQSLACVPLTLPNRAAESGQWVGVVMLGSRRLNALNEEDVRTLQRMAEQIALAIDNAYLFEEAMESAQELEKAERKYRSIFDNSVDGIFQTTPDGRFLAANLAMARMLGYETPEELMDTVTDIQRQLYVHPPFTRAMFKQTIEKHGIVQGFECKLRRKDDRQIWVSLSARVVRDEHGNVLYYEGTAEDVTERKQAQQALLESNRRLEETLAELKRTQQQIIQQERLHALGTMASGIAHDFNNALMPIVGYAEVLLMSPEDLDDKRKALDYLRTIHTAAQDAAQVVNRLREFYRQRDEADVLLPVDLHYLVQQAISLTQPKWKDQAQASGIDVRIETDLQDVPFISGDAAELREVLTNLIFNAVDAMPNGGRITIRTRTEEIGKLGNWETGKSGNQDIEKPETVPISQFPSFPISSHVVLEVSDTGVGMTEEVRQRCFEPFFSTKGERGTGLGLAMAYGVVQRHAGRIEVQSEEGKGTTFIIRLPTEAAQKTDGSEQETQPVSRSLRVLVVDDEPLVRQVVQEYLIRDGHIVETATNGREGMEKFRADLFDVVMTDWAMPEMNGEQFSAAIKRLSPLKPVILLTGFSALQNRPEPRPQAVDLIVGKPITLTALRQAIAQVTTQTS